MFSHRATVLLLAVGSTLTPSSHALDNGVALTPPMGFNPWNCFGISSKGTCKLPLPWAPPGTLPCHGFNESVILDVAKTIASTPLKDAGYEYVNLDCGYSTGFRQPNHSLTVNTTRYPHGMVWLGQQIHALGLKFGMYADAGQTQCCSRIYGPNANDGSLGYENIDADTFASWGVDYLKYDGCGNQAASYPAMRDALNKTGRPMVYSVHGPTACGDIGNLWRTTSDIDNDWESIVDRAILNDGFASNQSIGSWNDPDMLEVGNLWGPLGDAEGRSQFAMWCVMKAPLLLGNDVTNMTQATLATLSNPDAIAINQDALGVQARLTTPHPTANATSLTWTGPLAHGAWVALVVNNNMSPQTLSLDMASVLPSSDTTSYSVREVWTTKTLPAVTRASMLSFPNVGAHDCVLLRFNPQ